MRIYHKYVFGVADKPYYMRTDGKFYANDALFKASGKNAIKSQRKIKSF